MEKLKKGKAKDSQSKVKVLCCIVLLYTFQDFCSVGHWWINPAFYKFQEQAERSALEKIQQALMDGKPARSVSLTDFEKESIRHLCLLTMKPVIYVANVAESDLAEPGNNPHVKDVITLSSELQSGLVTISAQVCIFKKHYKFRNKFCRELPSFSLVPQFHLWSIRWSVLNCD